MIANATDFSIPAELQSDMRGWRMRALIVCVLGLVASAALTVMGGTEGINQFYRSYLFGFVYVIALTVGPLGWLMLQYVSGGAWGVVTRRACEAAGRTLPLTILLFIPVVLGINNLYPWAHADNVAADHLLQHKAPYLNLPFFLGRAALYFLGWLFISWRLNSNSAREDAEGHAAIDGKSEFVSGPGLVFYGFSVTFMSIDWIMSVDPKWFSTMFGLLFIANQALTSMAFLVTIMVLLSKYRPMNEVITTRHLHDLGKFLLALTMVWGYFSFSQFLIIWAGNLPEEIPWYLTRLNGGWQFIALLLVLGHFTLPFALLLSRDLKRNFKLLASLACFIILIRLVDLYWIVMPSFHTKGFSFSPLDITLPVGLIGIWLAFFLTQLEKRPLLPLNAPNLEEALQHGRH